MTTTKISVPKVMHRMAAIERAAVPVEDGPQLFRVIMSTDAQVEMPFGMEILDHHPDSVDLSFAQRGAPVNVNHSRDDHVGVIESVTLLEHQTEALIRFGRSQRAKEIQQDVEDGIRNYVSVGYGVMKYKRERLADGTEILRAVRWKPTHVSVVGEPADESAAILRGAEHGTRAVDIDEPVEPAAVPEGAVMSETQPTPASEPAVINAHESARDEMKLIHFMARQAGLTDRVDDWFARNLSSGQVAKEILKVQAAALEPGKGAASDDVWAAMEAKERQAYSIVKLVRAAADNHWQEAGLERAVSEAIERNYGAPRNANAFYVPLRMESRMLKGSPDQVRSLVAGTNSAGGNLVFTQPMEFIEILRNRTILGQAGARFLTGLVNGPVAFPRQITAGAAAWRAENVGSDDSDTDSTYDQLTLSPKYVHRHTAWSRQLLVQSSQDIESLVRDDLARVLAIALDYAGINGGGSNEPVGILGGTLATAVTGGAAGLAIALTHLCQMEVAVSEGNADGKPLAFVTNPAQRSKTRQVQYFSGTNGIPLWVNEDGADQLNGGRVLGYPAYVSNQVPKNLTKGTSTTVCSGWIFGDFSELYVATWGNGMEMVVDPYSKKKQGLIEIAAFLMADIGVRHGVAFATMKDAL
jgi:HK97 family phage major capsid protein